MDARSETIIMRNYRRNNTHNLFNHFVWDIINWLGQLKNGVSACKSQVHRHNEHSLRSTKRSHFRNGIEFAELRTRVWFRGFVSKVFALRRNESFQFRIVGDLSLAKRNSISHISVEMCSNGPRPVCIWQSKGKLRSFAFAAWWTIRRDNPREFPSWFN